MDQGNDVQDENLVNDQVAQAVDDSSTTSSDDKPAVDAQPEATPLVAEATVTPPAITPITPDPAPEAVNPITLDPAPTPIVTPTQLTDTSSVTDNDSKNDDLIEVKQKALEQLSPLVEHLDLPPEQKFDTYMEILRASDDRSIVQPAFDVAQNIEDEDKKAQALLDVINEVNYLTQDNKADK